VQKRNTSGSRLDERRAGTRTVAALEYDFDPTLGLGWPVVEQLDNESFR
jgi:hypothetical protein